VSALLAEQDAIQATFWLVQEVIMVADGADVSVETVLEQPHYKNEIDNILAKYGQVDLKELATRARPPFRRCQYAGPKRRNI